MKIKRKSDDIIELNTPNLQKTQKKQETKGLKGWSLIYMRNGETVRRISWDSLSNEAKIVLEVELKAIDADGEVEKMIESLKNKSKRAELIRDHQEAFNNFKRLLIK